MPTVAENIKKLKEERASAWEKAKPLVDLLQEENRKFTAEEQQTWERLNEEMDDLDRRAKELQRVAATEAEVTAFRQQIEGTDDIVAELAGQLRGLFAKNPAQREMNVSFSSREFKRALSVGTDSAGGNTVPNTFWSNLILPLRDFSSVLQAGATIVTTSSGEDITIPRLATPGSAAQYAEGATISGTDPTFDQVSWPVYKLGEIILASRELLQDSAVDIESLIGDLIGQNIGVQLGKKLIVGTGTSETTGLSTAATVGKTGATGAAGVPTFDELIDLFYSVTAPYRVRGSWITSDSAMASLRKIKDSNDQYIWQPAIAADTPDRLLGKPIFTDANIDTPAVSKKSVLFGDVSRYWVRMVNSLEIMRSDHAAFTSDQIAFRGILRAGGVLTDSSAVKAYKGGAS